MTQIAAGSLLIDSWNILYNVITDQITDTSKGARAGSTFVFSAWPNRIPTSRQTARKGDHITSSWVDYPILVLTNEVIASTTTAMNRSIKTKTVMFHTDVYNKSKANADRNTNQVNEILDITEEGFIGSGLFNFRVESSSYSEDTDPSGALIHRNTLNWAYDYRAIK